MMNIAHVSYQKNAYALESLDAVARLLEKIADDFELVTEEAGHTHAPHTHEEGHVLIGKEGVLEVRIDDSAYSLKPGDEIMIPSHCTHSAVADPNGCVYLWSEFA